MALIDKDQACQVCTEWERCQDERSELCCGIWEYLKRYSVVDAEPVVRCKDCRFWGHNDAPSSAMPDFRVCKRIGGLKVSGGYEYCSRGERREDTDD